MQIITWIQEKIDLWWGLILQLDPLMSLSLFLVYGILFEVLYSKSIYALKDFKRVSAATLNTALFLLSLWGLSEALTKNIMYAVPIAMGSWIGIFIQVTIEKRKVERETKRGASGETEE